MKSIYQLLLEASKTGEPAALGIITSVKGSSPQKKGAKAIFFADGRIQGTLGGGCLEAEVRERARLALIKQQPARFEFVLDHDFGWDDGLICGGKVVGLILPRAMESPEMWSELVVRKRMRSWGVAPDFSIQWSEGRESADWLYHETVSPACNLWIAGSGHVAQALAPLARMVDFEVTVFDDRPALANHNNFPNDTNLCVDAWDKLLQNAFPSSPTFGLIATRGHQHDAIVLRHWINLPFAYLGMIGSTRKRRLIFSGFLEEKIASEAQLEKVFCPAGLDIHSVSVPEIAMSVVAQMVQKRAELRSVPVAHTCA